MSFEEMYNTVSKEYTELKEALVGDSPNWTHEELVERALELVDDVGESEEEYVLVRFHIRDGDRESFQDTIITKTESDTKTDEDLIKFHMDDDATIDSDDPQGDYYWIYWMEALCMVMSRKPMTRETKELFNSYGVY